MLHCLILHASCKGSSALRTITWFFKSKGKISFSCQQGLDLASYAYATLFVYLPLQSTYRKIMGARPAMDLVLQFTSCSVQVPMQPDGLGFIINVTVAYITSSVVLTTLIEMCIEVKVEVLLTIFFFAISNELDLISIEC